MKPHDWVLFVALVATVAVAKDPGWNNFIAVSLSLCAGCLLGRKTQIGSGNQSAPNHADTPRRSAAQKSILKAGKPIL